jgi:lycopene cyclase domain-containing protein
VLGVRVYRSPRRLLIALAPTFVVFTAWDLVGILRGHWSYAPAFVSGLAVGPVPLEELVFFAVIPICALLTYEAVGKVARLRTGSGRLRFRWPDGLVRERAEPDRDA